MVDVGESMCLVGQKLDVIIFVVEMRFKESIYMVLYIIHTYLSMMSFHQSKYLFPFSSVGTQMKNKKTEHTKSVLSFPP